MVGPSRCVILVPANFGVEPACERSMQELERRGYPVWRVGGFASIDQGRSQMASDALAQGFEELFWLDADTEFDPDAVDQLRALDLPIVSGLYAKKGQRALASHLLPKTRQVVFGKGGGVIEILYAATGFLLTRRQVYEDIRRQAELPVCNERFGKPLVPYFMPLVIPDPFAAPPPAPSPSAPSPQPPSPGPFWYLADDFAFSHRARAAGYKIYADTTIRLGHLGRYSYQWEDAGISPQRYDTFTFHVT